MKARVRVGVLIFKKNKILLIKHINPINGEEFWITPGGGMKVEDKNIYSCGKRETFEECGLKIKLDEKVKYVKEWFNENTGKLELELFLLAKRYKGKITLENLKGLGADENWIKDVKFLDEKDMKSLNIFPSFLKNPKELLKKMEKGAIYIK